MSTTYDGCGCVVRSNGIYERVCDEHLNKRMNEQQLSLASQVDLMATLRNKYQEMVGQRDELLDALTGIEGDTCIDVDDLAPALAALGRIRSTAHAAIARRRKS